MLLEISKIRKNVWKLIAWKIWICAYKKVAWKKRKLIFCFVLGSEWFGDKSSTSIFSNLGAFKQAPLPGKLTGSVVNRHRFDADLDPDPGFSFDAEKDRIGIKKTPISMWSYPKLYM